MYPTVIIEHGLYPQHLGPAFIDVYRDVRTERVVAKKAKQKLKDATLKLAINGLTGNLQSEFSWCYDPKMAITLRLNCQLMMIMLLEELVLFGCKICQTNTDGILYIVEESRIPELQKIFDNWSTITKIGLETEYFERFYQFAINDYVGVQKGYSETKEPSLIKKKGLFIDKVSLGRGMAPTIIPKAINAKLVSGVPPEETVYNETDINQFLTYQKVSKDYEVEYGGQLIRHINRYYMSTNGARLQKCKINKQNGLRSNYISMCSSAVTLLNEFDDKPISERKINYAYYLTEIYKILNVLETKQLSLY